MANLKVDAPNSTEAGPDDDGEVTLDKLSVEDPSVVAADGAPTPVVESPSEVLAHKPWVSEVKTRQTIEIHENVSLPKNYETEAPNASTETDSETLIVGNSVSEKSLVADSVEKRNGGDDSFDLNSMMEPEEEGDTLEGGVAKDSIPSKSKDQKVLGKVRSPLKKAKSSQGSLMYSPPITPKKPLMNLRHILKKHEKKTETQQMHESGSIDFYGSMSSIPFLKINMPPEPKKKGTPEPKKKGRRIAKEKMSKKSGGEESTRDDDGKDKKKISIVTEARDGQKKTTEVTIISDYDQDDLSAWKNMSVVDEKCMEPVSDRPRDLLPLVPVPSPKKMEEPKPSPQHNQRGFHRPDDWVEFGHPTKRSPVKVTYKTKAVREVVAIDAPSVFSDDERTAMVQAELEKAKSAPVENSQPVGKTPSKRPTELVPQKISAPVGTPVSRTTAGSHKLIGPLKAVPKTKVEETKTNGPISPQMMKSPRKRDSRKVYQMTELAIQFHDGCVVNGEFRPRESVRRVIQDLTRDVLRNDIPLPSFDLCAESPDEGRKILNPAMTLEELNLVPFAKVYVTWTKPMDSTMKPGWYLLDDDEVPGTN